MPCDLRPCCSSSIRRSEAGNEGGLTPEILATGPGFRPPVSLEFESPFLARQVPKQKIDRENFRTRFGLVIVVVFGGDSGSCGSV
jgi:hypothetical protein